MLEGEGCFVLCRNHKSGKVYLYPKIVVNMTDEDVISHVASIWQTKVYKMPIYERQGYALMKQQWRAHITGARAAQMMRDLYPWLGTRRKAKIDEILQNYDNREPTEDRRRRSCQAAAAGRERNDAGQFVTL